MSPTSLVITSSYTSGDDDHEDVSDDASCDIIATTLGSHEDINGTQNKVSLLIDSVDHCNCIVKLITFCKY